MFCYIKQGDPGGVECCVLTWCCVRAGGLNQARAREQLKGEKRERERAKQSAASVWLLERAGAGHETGQATAPHHQYRGRRGRGRGEGASGLCSSDKDSSIDNFFRCGGSGRINSLRRGKACRLREQRACNLCSASTCIDFRRRNDINDQIKADNDDYRAFSIQKYGWSPEERFPTTE